MMLRGATPAERFFARVERTEGCWNWTGEIRENGYGSFHPAPKRGQTDKSYAHRFAFELMFGVIPEGMCVCHKCDNRRCVNPGHLFLGTHQDNMDDMVAKGRGCKGSRSPLSKLTESDVATIRALRAQGTTPADLARQYGVAPSNITQIIKRRTWRHVP